MINPKDYGLTEREYEHIIKGLQREPNHVEMGIFSALWSEHCSYKHTRPLLSQFPTKADWVLQGPGENAGVVSINKDWAVVFKIESHNHPSFVAPYDGSATGVGGLLRDVMAMGARPIGVKALLRSGPLDDEANQNMIKEIRQGAKDYADGCEVAVLGEELFTHPSFSTNPLVNVIVLGLARKDTLMQSGAGNPDNLFVYFGLPTGTHGVNGASFASKGMDETTKANPPGGDPLAGKELMDATLELIEKGLIIGLQDMGAAGLTSSAFEMADKAGVGFELELDQVPMTNTNITPYELMLSETQERMLASVSPDKLDDVFNVLRKYSRLSFAEIGKVTMGSMATLKYKGDVCAEVPIKFVVDDFPKYELAAQKSTSSNPESMVEESNQVNAVVVRIDNQESMQKASQIKPEKVTPKSGVCSVISIEPGNHKILLRTISNGIEMETDPYQSAYKMVDQAVADLQAEGAKPLAISDCMNFGDPDNSEVAYELQEAVRGLADACKEFDIPVVGGNVSLYNETNGKSILNQLFIGMIGIID